jgi:hypothetical protein
VHWHQQLSARQLDPIARVARSLSFCEKSTGSVQLEGVTIYRLPPRSSLRFGDEVFSMRRLTVTRYLILLVVALDLLCSHQRLCGAAEPGPIEIVDRSTIFQHTASNRDDPANVSGFNHAPNVALLPDGRLMAVWYSGPFEGAPEQRIMQIEATENGRRRIGGKL